MIYIPKGVCSRQIEIEIEDGLITKLEIIGGCNGNLQGIGKLVEGMPVSDVIKKLKGLKCGNKETSCPDQLANALEEYINKQKCLKLLCID